mgnify:FL=1
MFGYCIWYRIKDPNLIDSIHILSNYLNVDILCPHITFQCNMNNEKLKNIYFNLNKKNIDVFIKKGKLYQTKSDNFFALQQDYEKLNDNKNVYHISLAYKVDECFTEEEINLSNKINIPEIIDTKYITFQRWWCDTTDYTKWKLLDL